MSASALLGCLFRLVVLLVVVLVLGLAVGLLYDALAMVPSGFVAVPHLAILAGLGVVALAAFDSIRSRLRPPWL